jgi:hypothetical protein
VYLKAGAQAQFPRMEVTLKTADALLILEAGLGEADEMKLADWSVPFELAGICSPALREELERFTDSELPFVE